MAATITGRKETAINDAFTRQDEVECDIEARCDYATPPRIHSLPMELLLHIAKALPDLKALDALRRSSALFAEVFALHAAELMESLMVAMLHKDLVIDVRVFVLLLADRSTSTMDQHRKNAQTPLTKDVPVEAISIALRTYSYFHSLCVEVATQKLNQLYNLPHERLKRMGGCAHSAEEYKHVERVTYDVPTPSALEWIEEQKMLQGLFHLRSCGLSGQTYESPAEACYYFANWFSFADECRHLFDAHLQSIMHAPLPQQVLWLAPVARSDAIPHYDEDTRGDQRNRGWHTFHGRCCLNNHWNSSFRVFTKHDWPVFQKLGLGIWSDRRLAEELGLVNLPREKSAELEDAPQRMIRTDLISVWWFLYTSLLSSMDGT